VAQTARVFRIGWIGGGSAEGSALFLDVLRAGLAEHGYIEGRNLIIEARYGEEQPERVPALARELIALPVDLLFTQGAATRTVIKETSSVPIVYVFSADPVLAGMAQSLAHPGGNATGITLMSVELNGKRIELLRELLPRLQRVTVIANPAHAGAEFELQACESAARQLGVAIHQVVVRNPAELEESLSEIVSGKSDAVSVIRTRWSFKNGNASSILPLPSAFPLFRDGRSLPRAAPCALTGRASPNPIGGLPTT